MSATGGAGSFSILVICTANVCRSPLAAAILADWMPDARVRSAGIDAEPGMTMCTQSAAAAGPSGAHHGARQVTATDLDEADLILALDRTHRAAAARLAPGCRSRLFTLRQAADLAAHVDAILATGTVPEGAPPLPGAEQARMRWLVAELDAARGILASHSDDHHDIPDAHGAIDHTATLAEVAREATRLAAILERIR